MPSTYTRPDGTTVELDMFTILPPQDGGMNQYYGRIGEGKTYAATADAIADLNRGQVVYTSWKLKWDGYDERDFWWYRLLHKIGIKKYFWVFPKSNWHFFDMNANDALYRLGELNDCIIYLDEGHLLLDSYLATKMERSDRATILHTRHFDRTINVISQRPTAIHVVVRANVNRFFKLEKVMDWTLLRWRIVKFLKTEFQDVGADDKPNEERERDAEGNEGDYKHAISSETYFSRRHIREAYDTKYLRGTAEHSQPQNAVRVSLSGEEYPWSKEELEMILESDIIEA